MITVLPPWAQVTAKRQLHIERVVELLTRWSEQMRLPTNEAEAWRDVGRWHDAYRDADETFLRALTGDVVRPVGMLHGPAAALTLEREGETRLEVLDAVRWHTVGSTQWTMVGRALYMADFLEPGRTFMQADRAFLADHVPGSFDAVFRQVVRLRLEWTIREGKSLAMETVALWNSVR